MTRSFGIYGAICCALLAVIGWMLYRGRDVLESRYVVPASAPKAIRRPAVFEAFPYDRSGRSIVIAVHRRIDNDEIPILWLRGNQRLVVKETTDSPDVWYLEFLLPRDELESFLSRCLEMKSIARGETATASPWIGRMTRADGRQFLFAPTADAIERVVTTARSRGPGHRRPPPLIDVIGHRAIEDGRTLTWPLASLPLRSSGELLHLTVKDRRLLRLLAKRVPGPAAYRDGKTTWRIRLLPRIEVP